MSRNSITPSRAFLTMRRAGEDFRRLAIGAGAQIVDRHGAGGLRLRHALHLDQAHAAIAGDRQALVIAEARHFGARHLAGLQQRRAVLDFDLGAVDLQFRHLAPHSAACRRTAPVMVGIGRILVDALLDHMTEMADQALDRPGRGIASAQIVWPSI